MTSKISRDQDKFLKHITHMKKRVADVQKNLRDKRKSLMNNTAI